MNKMGFKHYLYWHRHYSI